MRTNQTGQVRFWVLFSIAVASLLAGKLVPADSSLKEPVEVLSTGIVFIVFVTIAIIEIAEGKLLNYPHVTRTESPLRYYLELCVVLTLAALFGKGLFTT